MNEYVEDTCGRLDVLINNAGIMIEENHRAMDMELEDLHKTMATNFYGPLMLTRTMVPLFKDSKDARVINVSSRMGQLSEMGGGHAAYRISKTALNALTVVMAKELTEEGIRVNTISPGTVRTSLAIRNFKKSGVDVEQAIAESKMASMKSGRTMAAQGGLMNLGGREMDLRGGGFVPMGAKERADDVPARLSKNEFVMTADAVRAAHRIDEAGSRRTDRCCGWQ